MLLGISVYSWVTIPLTTANLILQPLFPIGMPQVHQQQILLLFKNEYKFIYSAFYSLSNWLSRLSEAFGCTCTFTVPVALLAYTVLD